MRQYVLSMSGWMATRAKSTLLWTRDRLRNWWKNTVLEAIRAVVKYDYNFAIGITMWAIKKRWWTFLNKLPARRELVEWRTAYWEQYDAWHALDLEYKSLYSKHMIILEELRYWETRHAKVLNYIEHQMDKPEVGVN